MYFKTIRHNIKVVGDIVLLLIRYSIQPFRILYKTGDDDDDNNDDDDNDNNNNNVEEAESMLMTIAWPTTPSRVTTLMAN
jgi:hypothetical protein